MNDEACDVLVVGAGPAGALAALLLARQGRQVVLVDRAVWPREKSCGGCLNAAAISILQRHGLDETIAGAPVLDHFSLHVAGRGLTLPIAPGRAIKRDEFDAALVNAAVGAGVEFRPQVTARWPQQSRDEIIGDTDRQSPHRAVLLVGRNGTSVMRAGVILACDGLSGTLLNAQPGTSWRIKRSAWIGWASTCGRDCSASLDSARRSAIDMTIGQGGYVGRVRLGDGRTHIAAALDPRASHKAGGAANLIAQILSCPNDPALHHAKAYGAPPLTRYRPVLGGRRILAAGDACGYVEPFTGQGMAWALASAEALVNMIPAPGTWPFGLAQQWTRQHRALLGSSHHWCAALRYAVHRPTVAAALAGLGNLRLAHRTAERIGQIICGSQPMPSVPLRAE